MPKRTDIHRPSIVNGEEYLWICFKYYGASDLGAMLAAKVEFERFNAHRISTGATFSGHEHGGICHICGCGNISYACVFYHQKTNKYIVTGEDCARKLDMSCGNWSAFRRAVTNHLEAIAGKKKAEALLVSYGLEGAWALHLIGWDEKWQFEERTIIDIVNKLIKYGSISEKQKNFVRSLLAKIPTREADKASKDAEAAAKYGAAADCPTGRVRIKGIVLGLKDCEDAYGSYTSLLIEAETGFKVYGRRFNNYAKGDAVDMVATITPSENDAKFGFYKRGVVYMSPEDKKAAKAEEKRKWNEHREHIAFISQLFDEVPV